MGENEKGYHHREQKNFAMSTHCDAIRPPYHVSPGEMGSGLPTAGQKVPSAHFDAGLPRTDRALTTGTSADRLRRGGHTSLG